MSCYNISSQILDLRFKKRKKNVVYVQLIAKSTSSSEINARLVAACLINFEQIFIYCRYTVYIVYIYTVYINIYNVEDSDMCM